MRYREIINERIDTSALYERTIQFLDDALATEYERPKDRISAMSTALELAAAPYMAQWKSGIKNARGYELDKMHLQVICRISLNRGASFQAKKTQDGISVATIIIHIEPYEELNETTLTVEFAKMLSRKIAESFEHEMVHYTQRVSIKSDDPAVVSGAWNANGYPVTDKQSQEMTDDERALYLSSRSEITAYATNAARQLRAALGDRVLNVLSNLVSDEAMAASPAIRLYARIVKPRKPEAWRSFQRQIVAKLQN